MRTSTLVRRVLGVSGLIVESVELGDDGLVVDVHPRARLPRCGQCGRRRGGYDRRGARRWRHLGLADLKIWLRYAPRRVSCADCGVVTEAVPWAEHDSLFTRDFEEMVAFLAQTTDKTSVTRLMGIAWKTVGSIVERVVARKQDGSRLDGLRRIGIDEFSYRRRHRFITTVVDHDTRRVIWASEGRSADTLRAFYDELGPERCAAIETVTIDMCGGYITATKERLPNAQIVYDRFHVQRLASDAVDAVRREQLREVRGTPEGRALFRSRFVLWKRPWNLEQTERDKLADLQRTNTKLYRGYLLKEALAKALDYRQKWRAEQALKAWLAWASRSKLQPFVKAARTIRKRFDGVLAFVNERLTNGIVEGFNTRLRMVARRAFGFHSARSLIAVLFLCCGGIQLDPRLPGPTRE